MNSRPSGNRIQKICLQQKETTTAPVDAVKKCNRSSCRSSIFPDSKISWRSCRKQPLWQSPPQACQHTGRQRFPNHAMLLTAGSDGGDQGQLVIRNCSCLPHAGLGTMTAAYPCRSPIPLNPPNIPVVLLMKSDMLSLKLIHTIHNRINELR